MKYVVDGNRLIKIFEINDVVYVNEVYVSDDQPKAKKLFVESQEWWENVPLYPVYYNLQDDNGNIVRVPGSGNHYYRDVYETAECFPSEIFIK